MEKLTEYDIRVQKLEKIRQNGINPYAQKFDKKDMIWDILKVEKEFRNIEDIISNPSEQYKTAWRILLKRPHWKLSFASLMDESGSIQLMLHKDFCQLEKDWKIFELKDISAYSFFEKYVDVWDFIGAVWELFVTHKWEKTLFVKSFSFLTKALEPLGDKFHWLWENEEKAYRQRYLDMIFNKDVLDRMVLRSKFLQVLRQYYYESWFLEVETPILWNYASWAAAKPFVTYHEDMDCEMYLRISPETNLKKATVWGLEKIFEVAKDFRNEWSDPSHMQEFTMIEHYAAYWNHKDNMTFTERMFDFVFDNIPELNKQVEVVDKNWVSKLVDFSTPWARVDYISQIKKDSWLDVSSYQEWDEEKLRADILSKWLSWEGIETQGLTTLIDYLYKKVTRPKIVWPAFVVNYPALMQPLARHSDNDENIVEQWQLLINGWEVIKAYWELVDPIQQQKNFDLQAKAAAAWDEEATPWDGDFVKAMSYGMPPQSGWWMWVDRVFALLTSQQNLRDVVLFPLMKPLNRTKISNGRSNDHSQKNEKIEKINIDIEPAKELVEKYSSDTIWHLQTVANLMKFFALKNWEDENYWYIVGLLHDIDWDHIKKDAPSHLWYEFEKIIFSLPYDEKLKKQLVEDIRSHYPENTWIEPKTNVQKYLSSVDELSGLMQAYAKMRWGFEWMEVAGVLKKIKDKGFAAWVNREHTKNSEKYLWIELKDFINQMIEGFQSL